MGIFDLDGPILGTISFPEDSGKSWLKLGFFCLNVYGNFSINSEELRPD
jgi:hypothetical protein